MNNITQALGFGVASGFAASWLLYDRTHGDDAHLPEIAGTAVGSLVVVATFRALRPQDDDGLKDLLLAFIAVGFGVVVSRLRGEILAAFGGSE